MTHLEIALNLLKQHKHLSVSLLERKLKITYWDACRICLELSRMDNVKITNIHLVE